MGYKQVVDKLEEQGRLGPTSWDGSISAHCPGPVHGNDDQRPSLSVKEGDDERALVYCHAGCETLEIVEALGLSMSDLFMVGSAPIADAYVYVDEDDRPLTRVLRMSPKGFTQQRYENGGWKPGLNDARRVLYRLPDVLAISDEPIYVCEGEKDADNIRAFGQRATTNLGGALNWRSEYNEFLRGNRVVVVGDNDDAGRERVERIAQSLYASGVEHEIIFPRRGCKDITDHLMAGFSMADMVEYSESSPEHKDWVDLIDVTPENVEWLWPGWVPKRVFTIVSGKGGIGKSTFLYDLAASTVIKDGGRVLIFTAEDHLASVVRPRLEVIERTDEGKADLRQIKAWTSEFSLPDDIPRLRAAIDEIKPHLVIIDPIVAFLTGEVSPNDDKSVRSQVVRPLHRVAEETGVAVVAVIHTNKGMGRGQDKVGGSVGWVNGARSVIMAATKEDEGKGYGVLWVEKNNYSVKPEPRLYRIVADTVFHDGKAYETSRIEWVKRSMAGYDPSYLLAGGPRVRGKEEQMVEVLEEIELEAGDEGIPRDELAAMLKVGLRDRTLRRALAKAGWDTVQEGQHGARVFPPQVSGGPSVSVHLSHLAGPPQTPPDLRKLPGGTGGTGGPSCACETLGLILGTCPECETVRGDMTSAERRALARVKDAFGSNMKSSTP